MNLKNIILSQKAFAYLCNYQLYGDVKAYERT